MSYQRNAACAFLNLLEVTLVLGFNNSHRPWDRAIRVDGGPATKEYYRGLDSQNRVLSYVVPKL